MAINWTDIGKQVETSVAGVLGSSWQTVSATASIQFQALIAAGRYIEEQKDKLGPDDYKSLKLMQERALEGVLQSYAAISIDTAQRAAEAAWSVVATALKTAYPLLVFL